MTPWVTRLIIANVAVYFLQQTVRGITDSLVFVPALALTRPWTVITYMFLHGGLGHIFFNMLSLYFFGPRVEERLGPNRFIWLYTVSGIAGALLSFIFAPRAAILGASGAVFGVMFGFAKFWPKDRIFVWGIFPIEARILVLIMAGLALFSGSRGSQGGVADFAHLGGFVGAWAYLAYLDRAAGTRRFKTQTLAKTADNSLANWRKVDPQRVHEVNREELNRILDKINRSGLTSLTPQERLFLSNFVPSDSAPPPS
jgi:membrane associated rhomboid family serine protease